MAILLVFLFFGLVYGFQEGSKLILGDLCLLNHMITVRESDVVSTVADK